MSCFIIYFQIRFAFEQTTYVPGPTSQKPTPKTQTLKPQALSAASPGLRLYEELQGAAKQEDGRGRRRAGLKATWSWNSYSSNSIPR